jgi:hypothetical protein
LGKEELGPTPFAPLKVPAGRYKLRLVYQDRTERRTVVVKPDKIARVIVRFDQP